LLAIVRGSPESFAAFNGRYWSSLKSIISDRQKLLTVFSHRQRLSAIFRMSQMLKNIFSKIIFPEK
jgi:hypothetical protein